MNEYISVSEYARKKGCSSQHVYALVKDGKLKHKVENGKKLVENNLISETAKAVGNQVDNEFLKWLQSEVARLNEHVASLEAQLIACKSESTTKIVDVYERKDQQLKEYIEFLNNSTQQLIASAVQSRPKDKEDQLHDTHDAEIIEEEVEPIKLTTWLKDKGYDKERRVKIIKRVNKALLQDSSRFLIQDGKIHIYPDRQYSDLF